MERLKQENLECKNDITDFVEKTYSDENLMNINKKVTSIKTKDLEVEEKLNQKN